MTAKDVLISKAYMHLLKDLPYFDKRVHESITGAIKLKTKDFDAELLSYEEGKQLAKELNIDIL